MTNTQRMENDLATLHRRQMEDKATSQDRERNDALTGERRFKADEVTNDNRLRNDEVTAERRDAVDGNTVMTVVVSLLLVLVAAVGILSL